MHRLTAYFTLAALFAVAGILLYLPLFFILRKKGKSIIRQMSYLGLIFSIFIILFATIFFIKIKFNPDIYHLNLQPFKWISEGKIIGFARVTQEIIPNILLFIPLGFLLPSVFERMRKIYTLLPTALCFSVSIEVFQYFIGRVSDVDDVIANTLGAVIGFVIFKIFENKKWFASFSGNNADIE